MSRRKKKEPVSIKRKLSNVLSVLFGIILSGLGALVLFAVFAGLTVLLGYSLSDTLVINTVFIQLAYFLSFYFIYARRLVKKDVENLPFSFKRTCADFFRGKSAIYVVLALVLSAVNEIALLITEPNSNLISIALAMIYPLVGSIKIKVLRSVLNYMVFLLGSFAVFVLKSFIVNRAKAGKQ